MLNVIYAECHNKVHYAEYHNAECHYSEYQNAECRFAQYHYAECCVSYYAGCRFLLSVTNKTTILGAVCA